MNKYSLYLMIFLYGTAGVLHFIFPKFYKNIMPVWLSYKLTLVYLSGVAEVVLALLLVFENTRIIASWIIVVMLVVFFFIIHVPQAVLFYRIKHRMLLITLLRLPLQFILIAWAMSFT